jgi:TPR repeat protein
MPWRVASYGIILLLSSPLHADYQTGLDAYGQGDYATAMTEWREVTDGPPTAVSPGVFVEAHYAVAMLYWEGRGVAQDFGRARHWLERAAGMNHAGAQVKLGFLYTDGKGVAQDQARAFEWFSKAAKQGNVDALYNLGVSYLYGWGMKPDTTLAKQYLAAASALGDPAAEQALQDLLAVTPVAAEAAPTVEPKGAEAQTAVIPEAAQPLSGIHDEAWILARNPEHYTLQVILLSSPDKLHALVAGHEALAPFATYTLQGAGKPLYALVQGDYPDLGSARRARDAFPPAIEKPGALWIRSFGQVQDQIRD